MSHDEVRRFAWLDDSVIGEAGCITIIEHGDVSAAMRAFGGDPATTTEVELGDAPSDPDAPVALVRRVGDRVLVVEYNGFEGSRSEVLRRLPGRSVSAYWNVNALTRFSYAADGKVLTAFEAMLPSHRTGAEPDALVAQLADLPWHDTSVRWVPTMLALAARVTGFVLEPAHISGPLMRVPLVPWPRDMPDAVAPRFEALTYSDPALSFALQHADPACLRAAAREAVRVAAAAARFGDHEVMRAVIDGDASATDRSTLEDMARAFGAARRWPQFRAVQAARAATGTDAVAAAFAAISEAADGLDAAKQDPAPLRAAAMAALGNLVPPSGSGSLAVAIGDQPWDRYGWIDQHWLSWAAAITFVRGRPADAPTLTPAGRPRGPVLLERGQTRSLQVGEWTLLIEVGEAARQMIPHLTALTIGGEAVQLKWSARGQAYFWHVAGGTVQSTFEVFRPERAQGSALSELDELRAGLVFPLLGRDAGQQAPVLLALAERITGLAFTPELLDADWTEL